VAEIRRSADTAALARDAEASSDHGVAASTLRGRTQLHANRLTVSE
jgi:hypothetical protein